MRTSTPRDRGLTLVEIVVASAVLAVLLLGLFTTMNISQRSDSLSRERNAATEIAFQELDLLMGGNFDDMGNGIFQVRYDTGTLQGGVPISVVLKAANPYPIARVTPVSPLTTADLPNYAGQVNVEADPYLDPANTGLGRCGPDVAEIRITVAWRPSDWDPVTNPKDSKIEIVTRRCRGQ